MHSDKFSSQKLKEWGMKYITPHKVLAKTLESKGFLQKVEIRNIIR